MSLLDVEGLTVRFGAVTVCDELGLAVEAGELVGIVGPNGCGKTTLFRSICGEISISSGTITWNGANVTRWPPNRIARAGLVRTFQHSMVFPAVSVRENLRMARECARRHAGKGQRNQRVDLDDLLKITGLAEIAGQQASTLTTGQLRMVGVGLALVTQPLLLMLDEPAAGLSSDEGAVLANLLRQVHDLGVILVVVDHDMGFLLPLVDRLVVLETGRLLMQGPPKEVAANEQVRELYIGSRFRHGKSGAASEVALQ